MNWGCAGGGGGVNGIRILNRFQGWGVGLTAESIALTTAVKYCGSCKGSQSAKPGRLGVAEPTAPLFTQAFFLIANTTTKT